MINVAAIARRVETISFNLIFLDPLASDSNGGTGPTCVVCTIVLLYNIPVFGLPVHKIGYGVFELRTFDKLHYVIPKPYEAL